MEELLNGMTGKHVDVLCSGAVSLRGEVVKVEGGVLHLKDENETKCYVAIEKIIAVWEPRNPDEHRAGFVATLK